MNIQLGKYNILEVVKQVDFGVYLDGGDDGEILLPTRYVPKECKIGDRIRVFIYLDNEERLVATTLTPRVQVGQFAMLQVKWVNQYGAFLDWGLMKDLFVPFREQRQKMEVGKRYVVYAFIDDESFRIVGSARIDRHLAKGNAPYEQGEEVDILVWQKTELGFKVIVENLYGGLLYEDEVFRRLCAGMRLKAYVKQVRPDGKIDLTLQKQGREHVTDFSEALLRHIREHGGATPLNDKSPAEEIYAAFGVSKKTFKKAVGDLYKRRLILIGDNGLRLADL